MSCRFYVVAVLVVLAPVSGAAQIAAGGAFTLEKSVVTAGGGASSNGALAVTGTGGQAAAGTTSANASLSQRSGFWIPEQLAPTASGVTVGGRVTTADGRGIRNARVTMTDADGTARSVSTGSFGYFRFMDVAAGGTYVFDVSAGRFTFTVPTQVLTVFDNAADLSFVAEQAP
jgi:hypothetical protein